MSKSTSPNRRAPEEWEAIIRAWKASGLSAEVFARGKGFSASSLYAWRKRLGGSSASDDPPNPELSFVPVVVEEDTGTSEPFSWRLETPSGIALSMSGPGAMHGLEFVIRALGERGVL